MGRVLAFDYGKVRTGMAVTDPLRIIATPLETVPTSSLFEFLSRYIENEQVDEFVVGRPRTLANKPSEIDGDVTRFVSELKRQFPGKAVSEMDERFTSRMAKDTLIRGGMKKKERRNKGHVDRISATLILQDFLQRNTRPHSW